MRALGIIAMTIVVGCGDKDAGTTADAEVPIDVSLADAPPVVPCSAVPTSTVELDKKTFDFVALGNVDAGGEANCSGPPEAVTIAFAQQPLDARNIIIAESLQFTLQLPVTTGERTVTISTVAGMVTATLDVTSVTVEGTGPGLMQVTGKLTGDVKGEFSASHCTQLDLMCI